MLPCSRSAPGVLSCSRGAPGVQSCSKECSRLQLCLVLWRRWSTYTGERLECKGC